MKAGGDWSGYNYSYFCPAYSFGPHGSRKVPLDILNANHISLCRDKGYQKAREIVDSYLRRRGGAGFNSKLTFYDVDITYLDSQRKFDDKRPLYDLEKCGAIRYYFRFLYKPDKITEYRFGIALDSFNQIISPASFPNYEAHPHFDKLIPAFKAYKAVVKTHREFVYPLESVELEYNGTANRFEWVIQQKKIPHPRALSYSYKTGYVKVDANTGLTVDSGYSEHTVISEPVF
jgi:hypothetical protein